MKISNISIPEVYEKESADFRFFLRWIEEAFQKIKYDHEHAVDLYDPLRCPRQLLWMLSDTMGYKYDDRLPPAFCRLVLLYFISMIKLKGSKNGVMLAAELNLAQFNLLDYGKEKEILYDRLEDTSIPVNCVSVVPHVDEGYIDVVYFSDKKPIDACIEYVRPLGMYLFPRAGVTIHARTKIWVDGMLTNNDDMQLSIGPTHIGHYSREDYARLQKTKYNSVYNKESLDTTHRRKPVWRYTKGYEVSPDGDINPGYRALYNLQISNNEHIVNSLLKPMFSLGYGPQSNDIDEIDYYENNKDIPNDRPWDIKNLRYMPNDNAFGDGMYGLDIQSNENSEGRSQTAIRPYPRVNPVLGKLGDAISMNPNPLEIYPSESIKDMNTSDKLKHIEYTKSNDSTNNGKDVEVISLEDEFKNT